MNLNETSTLFVTADLVADSVLHVGSGDYLNYRDTASLFRDGRGLPVIPGSSFAGVFIEAAQAWRREERDRQTLDTLWPRLTGKGGRHNDYTASALEFATLPLTKADAMPTGAWSHERDLVRIDRKTRTAAHGAKFAFEAMEPGLRFRLIIRCELDALESEEERAALCRLLIAVLDRCWGIQGPGGVIGANSARGMGWFHIENLRFLPIDSSERLRSYLKAGSDADWVDESLRTGRYLGVDEMESSVGPVAWHPPIQLWPFTLTPRAEPGGYGCWPAIVRSSPGANVKEADFEFTSVRRWRLDEGAWSHTRVPVIPGSSLRGAARSLLERLAEGSGAHLDYAAVQELFGTTEAASPLRFRDALFLPPYEGQEDKYETQLERIGLDEFTRSVYGAAKFNYIPLFEGCFQACAALRQPTEAQQQLLNTVFDWGGEDAPWLGVGAGASPMIWRRDDAA